MSIEEQYFKDFDKEKYDAALVLLWEKHCAGYIKWPPTLKQVKKQIEDLDIESRF